MRAAVPPVLVPGRHRQPCHARDARLHARGRRARLLAGPRVRRRVRRPGPGRFCVVGDGEAETGPLAAAGTPTSSSTRGPTARSSPSSTSTATRSPTRRSWRGSRTRSWRPCSSATATSRSSWRATTRRHAPARWRASWTRSLDEIAAIQRKARQRRRREPPALADDRPAQRRRAGPAPRRSTACRRKAASAPTRSRFADVRENPGHLALLEDWLRSYGPDELFDEHGRAAPRARRTPPPGTAA